MNEPPGGRWKALDPVTQGRVLVLATPDPGRQATALVERMQELRHLGGGDWSDFAVLARTRGVLEPIRALCEAAGIPVAWREDLPAPHRVREVAAFLDRLKALGPAPITADCLAQVQGLGPVTAEDSDRSNPWRALVRDLIRICTDEAGNTSVPGSQFLEVCYEVLVDRRRDRRLGNGVLLSTLHGAKGMEFSHVCIADGCRRGSQPDEEERRLFYVGMTRARETLTLGLIAGGDSPWVRELAGDFLFPLQPRVASPRPEIIARRYRLLTLADLDLGYAGRFPPDHPLHARLTALKTGDKLRAVARSERVLLCDGKNATVARLSRRSSSEWLPKLEKIEEARIVALLRRKLDDGDPCFRSRFRSEIWEVPLVEIQVRE